MKFFQSTTQNYSFLNNSATQTNDNEKLNNMVQSLEKKVEKLTTENYELKKINKSLNSKLNLLINDNDIVKNVKLDMQDYSDFTNYYNNNEDTLKEFFYLLVICEKMKYLNLDHIWMIESSVLFREIQNLDLAFYEWGPFLTKRLETEYEDYYIKANKNENGSSVMNKLKNIWYESSLTFFNKIKGVKNSISSSHMSSKLNDKIEKNDKMTNIQTNNQTNNLTNTNYQELNSKEIKRKYKDLIKSKGPVDKIIAHKEINDDIEKLLLDNDNSFLQNTEISYNSFLNN